MITLEFNFFFMCNYDCLFFRVVGQMLLFENKADVNAEEGEDLEDAFTRKMPVICNRLLNVKDKGVVAPPILVWDALVVCLSHFEAIERVPYCHMLLPLMDDILPGLFDKLPPNPGSLFMEVIF